MTDAQSQLVGAFARHETFHPRYGWFRKAYERVLDDEFAFGRDDAPVRFGVGKNMVRAIRYWGRSAKLISAVEPGSRSKTIGMRPTQFAHKLLADDGWDPYLEDAASLWLLHWKLLSPPCHAPVFWYAFNVYRSIEFTEQQLLSFAEVEVMSNPAWDRIAKSSVKKDVACLLRSYTGRRERRSAVDDSIDCPFRDLGILRQLQSNAELYRFVVGSKASLPDAIVAYSCADFAAQKGEPSTITASRLSEPGGPGRALMLDEYALREALESYSSDCDHLQVVTVAGQLQVVFKRDPHTISNDILDDYYSLGSMVGRTQDVQGPAAVGE